MNDGVLRYGAASDGSVRRARENFPDAGFDTLSLCCTPIEVLAADGEEEVLSRASAFFWKKDKIPYIVTNWHVVSGLNPFTMKPVGSRTIVPHRVRYFGRNLKRDGEILLFQERPTTYQWKEDMVQLLRTPPMIDTAVVDLWAAPILPGTTFGKGDVPSHEHASRATCFINEATGSIPIRSSAGNECYVLGYPLNNYEGLRLPIWKRASISTDTNMGVMEKPMFLIDVASTEAMSGSPVIRRVKTGVVKDQSSGALVEAYSDQLIGVYAGRLESQELDRINVGYCWYSDLIDKVIEYYDYKI